jgi:hypothetical protein
MTLALLEGRSARFHVVPEAQVESFRPKERDSDAWPEWSTELSPAELATAAEKNTPSKVFGEIVGAVAYSIGLVVLLIWLFF